jgi:predicted phage terminase large subunit-like protein
LVDNRRLAKAYPEAVGRGTAWRSNVATLRNGAAIEAIGTGQRIRGRRRRAERPTLIVCDDLQNDSHMVSPLQRERSRTWFHGTLLKAGTRRTNLLNLATALHCEALAMQLHATPGWTSRIFRAIEQWPTHGRLWEEWEAIYTQVEDPHSRQSARQFYDDRRAAMDEGAVVLWPDEEDLYSLMCLRVESGRSAFEREKQNSPIAPELCEWPEDYFGEAIWFDDWPSQLVVKILTLDPSKGADAHRGDYSAFVRLGVDRQGVLYVEADLARQPTPQIVAEGVEHYCQFAPDAFGVEANQFQELLGESFEAEFRRRGLLAVRPWLITNHVNKLVRIRRLGPYLSAGRLRLKRDSPSTRLLVEQLRQFPAADHDDGPDALEMAIRLAGEMLRGTVDDGLGSRLRLD